MPLQLRPSQAIRKCQILHRAGTSPAPRAINPHLRPLAVTCSTSLRPDTRPRPSTLPRPNTRNTGTMSRPSTPPTPDPLYSPDQPADLPTRATSLLRTSAWTLSPSRIAITRVYHFKTFKAAWAFMNLVADECKRQRHHPSWHNLYNEVTIEWTTHRPKGLSIKDVQMAEFCDRVAIESGAVEGEEGRKCC